jgi:hypothetical protein
VNVRDELQEVGAVHGAVPEASPGQIPVRVKTATADLQHMTVQAFRREGSGTDLPGDRGRVIESIVETVG